jgi:hypothetical protein
MSVAWQKNSNLLMLTDLDFSFCIRQWSFQLRHKNLHREQRHSALERGCDSHLSDSLMHVGNYLHASAVFMVLDK